MSTFLTKTWNEESEKMISFLSEIDENIPTNEFAMSTKEIQRLLDEA